MELPVMELQGGGGGGVFHPKGLNQVSEKW